MVSGIKIQAFSGSYVYSPGETRDRYVNQGRTRP